MPKPTPLGKIERRRKTLIKGLSCTPHPASPQGERGWAVFTAEFAPKNHLSPSPLGIDTEGYRCQDEYKKGLGGVYGRVCPKKPPVPLPFGDRHRRVSMLGAGYKSQAEAKG